MTESMLSFEELKISEGRGESCLVDSYKHPSKKITQLWENKKTGEEFIVELKNGKAVYFNSRNGYQEEQETPIFGVNCKHCFENYESVAKMKNCGCSESESDRMWAESDSQFEWGRD